MYAYIIPYLNAIILSILLRASPIYSYPEFINLSMILLFFMYDLYLWMCIDVFLISMYYTLKQGTLKE